MIIIIPADKLPRYVCHVIYIHDYKYYVKCYQLKSFTIQISKEINC